MSLASPMTDWLPWAFVMTGGAYGVLWLLVDAVEAGTEADLGQARTATLVAAGVSLLVLLVYVAFGEVWLPY